MKTARDAIVTLINKKKRIDEKRRDLLKALMVTLLSYELINKKKPKTVTRPDNWLNVTFFTFSCRNKCAISSSIQAVGEV